MRRCGSSARDVILGSTYGIGPAFCVWSRRLSNFPVTVVTSSADTGRVTRREFRPKHPWSIQQLTPFSGGAPSAAHERSHAK